MLYCVRHAPSCSNLEVRDADPLLCSIFPQDFFAEGVGFHSTLHWLLDKRWDARVIYCSYFPRAIMTAQILCYLANQRKQGRSGGSRCIVRALPGVGEEHWVRPSSVDERLHYRDTPHPAHHSQGYLCENRKKIRDLVAEAWLFFARSGLYPSRHQDFMRLAASTQNELIFELGTNWKGQNGYQRMQHFLQEIGKITRGSDTAVLVSHGNFLHNYLVQTDLGCPQDALHNLEIVFESKSPPKIQRYRFEQNAAFLSPSSPVPRELCAVLNRAWSQAMLQPSLPPKRSSKIETPLAMRLLSQVSACPVHEAEKIRSLSVPEKTEAQNKHFTAAYLGHTTWSYFHFFATQLVKQEEEQKLSKNAAMQLVNCFVTVVTHWFENYPCQMCRQQFLSDKGLVGLRKALSKCREVSELHRILVDIHNQVNKSVAAQQTPPGTPLIVTYEEARELWEF